MKRENIYHFPAAWPRMFRHIARPHPPIVVGGHSPARLGPDRPGAAAMDALIHTAADSLIGRL